MKHPHHGGPPPFDIEGADSSEMRVFRALKRTMRLNRQLMMRMLAEKGGHPGQTACLIVLGHHEGISQRDLAERLHLAPPTVTTMLQKMERHGFIERRVDENDQRLTRISLTKEGREQSDALSTAHGAYVDATFGAMSETDRDELTRLLGVLADTMTVALDHLDDRPEA
jgi:DNA-binding MarR family transcriptional regulator